jgi:hypothetical protein
MTTRQSNNLNSCCYDHVNDDLVNDASLKSNGDHMFRKIAQPKSVPVIINRCKYLLHKLTPTITSTIVTFLLNRFNK